MTGFDIQMYIGDEYGDGFIGAQSDVDSETMAARPCFRSCLSGRRDTWSSLTWGVHWLSDYTYIVFGLSTSLIHI